MTAPRAHYDHRAGTPRGHLVPTWFGWRLKRLGSLRRLVGQDHATGGEVVNGRPIDPINGHFLVHEEDS